MFPFTLLVAHDMVTVQCETFWPDYATSINALAQVEPAFEWLARSFSYHPQRQSSGRQLNILESHEDIIEDNACSLDI